MVSPRLGWDWSAIPRHRRWRDRPLADHDPAFGAGWRATAGECAASTGDLLDRTTAALAAGGDCLLLQPGGGSVRRLGSALLSQDLRTNPGTAALGYTIFSCAMLVGRLRGDKLVRNIGPAPVVRLGVALGMSGIMAGMVISTAWAFLLSFGLVGLGFSTVIPIVYRTAGSMPGIDGAAGVAGVATACYSAFLVGPPLMCFVSDQLSLRAAFVMVGIVTSIAIVLAPAVHNQSPAPLGVQNGLETITDPAPAVAL